MTTAPNIEMIASSLRHCSLHAGGGGGGRRRPTAGRGGHQHGEGGDDSERVTVELNSDVPLPYHWEQCLDIRTGTVYYINWEDGTRTTVDPRTALASSPTPRSTSSASRRSRRRASCTPSSSSGYTSVSSVGAAEEEVTDAWARAGDDVDSGYDNDNEEDDDDDDEEEEEESSSSGTTSSSSSSTGSSSRSSSAVSSTLSSFSPTDESASGDNGSAIGDNNNNNDGPSGHVLVAAGCRACFMYFMVPKHAVVCPKCGSSGLLHLSSNGY